MSEYLTKNEPVDMKPYIVYTGDKNIVYSCDKLAEDPFAPENRELLYDEVHEFSDITTTAAEILRIRLSDKYYSKEYIIVGLAERVDANNDLIRKEKLGCCLFLNVNAANGDYSVISDGSHKTGFRIYHDDESWLSGPNNTSGIVFANISYDPVNHPGTIEIAVNGKQNGSTVVDGKWRIRVFAIKYNLF